VKVLVIGSGGREHALVWGLAKSPHVTELWTTGKNAGICEIARCVPLEEQGINALCDWAASQQIDLTVVGPEAQLTVGIADAFRGKGLAIVGPTKAAAEIEGSKVFAKELMQANGIPTAGFAVCDSAAEAKKRARQFSLPLVIKADGLAAGKGVSICSTWAEVDQAISDIMEAKMFGDAGERAVIEEYLSGMEVSVFAFVSGTDVAMMPPAQDHKAIYDGDQGPNTGGMGAYSPVTGLSATFLDEVKECIIQPTVNAMAAMGRPFSGILFAGLMVTDQGPKVLEFNCRFGDPETQALIPRLESDLYEVLSAVAHGNLNNLELRWSPATAVCVVLASAGYPGDYVTGFPISGLGEVTALPDVQVFHSGTKRVSDQVVTAGGRVLGITGLGATKEEAIARAYSAVDRIDFIGKYCRKDIAQRPAKQS
jgi:phosphoribosylamine--glycine ligase